MPEPTTPEWVKHAVFYQIFPDRFAASQRIAKPINIEPWDSDPTEFGYKGGDLLGVEEHLDHIVELGATALYFNPIFQSASNHRYHTHNYYRVDPLLGGDAAFDVLLAACKRRGLRVILDGVFNHASRGFFQFNDILENGQASPWVDWFDVHEFPPNAYDYSRRPGYTAWWGLHALPKFNTDNPQVREFLMGVGEHWMRKGIDGWRLDVPNEITTPGFWQEFRTRVRVINPEAYIVAEIWDECPQWLGGDTFDAAMNYPLTEALIRYTVGDHIDRSTVEGRGYRPYPAMDAPEFAARLQELFSIYAWPTTLAQLNLLDSHDTARFISIAGNDEASLRLATVLLFTLPGAPSVYYGDEIGLSGGLPDRWARKTFPWSHPEHWNHDLLEFYKRVIHLRREHAALQVGAYTTLLAEGEVLAFARTLGDSMLIVAVNAGATPSLARIPLPQPRPRLETLFGNTDATIGDNTLVVLLQARSGTVFDCSPST
jgi:cyclomaltodextrinase